ncbi:MAG: transcription antitermination protein NusB [Muribaculaceae bacterium]|nr:transcription antitermination protein NusB [Muribaculaceae bacterium]
MINRILIRIKAIQILYSFMLVEKRFSLESQPTAPTKEKRFAYSLYRDMLLLMVKVAREVNGRGSERPLMSTRFISQLQLDDTFNAIVDQYRHESYPLEYLVDTLADKIKNSGIYKLYRKASGNNEAAAEHNLWREIFDHILAPDAELRQAFVKRTNYTLKGEERMKDMMHRTFTNFLASQDDLSQIDAALYKSLDQARELYFRLLMLPVELTDMQERVIDENRNKHLRTEEDINPNLKFVENRLVYAIRNNEILNEHLTKYKFSWQQEDPIMMQRLLNAITTSDVYLDYMASAESSMAADGELWRSLFKKVILENPDFLEAMEEKSVFWNDDLEIISTFVFKSFRRFEEGASSDAVLDQYKDEEDRRFGSELIGYVHRNRNEYRLLIEDALKHGSWETERVAFMDMVILETALAEIMNFPKIPLQVSINEYIELAKSYSTAKRGVFVHGVLAQVTRRLQEEGRLLKK